MPFGVIAVPFADVSETETVHFVACPAFTAAGLQLSVVFDDRFTWYVTVPVTAMPEIPPWTTKVCVPTVDMAIGDPFATAPVQMPVSRGLHSNAASTVWPSVYVAPLAGAVIEMIGVNVTDGGLSEPPMMSGEPIQAALLTKLEPPPPPLPLVPQVHEAGDVVQVCPELPPPAP